jgi:hypothetical protein
VQTTTKTLPKIQGPMLEVALDIERGISLEILLGAAMLDYVSYHCVCASYFEISPTIGELEYQ